MKISTLPTSWRRWLAASLAAAAATAGAVDIVAVSPAVPLADLQLSIGARSVMLPPGNWSYIARSEGAVKSGGVDRKAPHFTAYAMDVNNGRMLGGVVVRMPVNSSPVSAWNEEPCKVEGTIFKDEFSGNFNLPECLVIYKRRTHMATKLEGFYGQAQEWAAAQSVKLPGPVYEIVYTRFGANDFGILRVFVPQQALAGDDQMIAWAKQLPMAFKPLFENRQSMATLPALPVRSH